MAKSYDYCATCRRPKRPSSWAYCCYQCEKSRGMRERFIALPLEVLKRIEAKVKGKELVQS